ncbi:MAG: selenoneine biosynthesis selenosugar synthase SenB [Haloechinothrix sp.]
MILMVSPAPPSSSSGNWVTAERWASHLTAVGHRVEHAEGFRPGEYRALIALHARKSAAAIRQFRAAYPARPIVVALTGTDLYPDLTSTGVDPAVLEIATRIVVLQPQALAQLDDELRPRARVIVQSMPPIPSVPHRSEVFEVAFLAHLREVKDPLRVAEATRLLPADSRVVVNHAGAGLDPELSAEADAESRRNPRYTWLGELPRLSALQLLARSRLLVLTSRHEGGANVISEALAAGVPVLSSRIPGSVGLLGTDYPGYVPVGDTAALADTLRAAETDRNGYYTTITRHCWRLRALVDPQRERRAWADLLAELDVPAPTGRMVDA